MGSTELMNYRSEWNNVSKVLSRAMNIQEAAPKIVPMIYISVETGNRIIYSAPFTELILKFTFKCSILP